jgi:hypothetical protein
MNIKAIGRSALILATGLFVCFAGPSQAAGAEASAASAKSEAAAAPVARHKYARHGSRHWKKYVHRRSSKVALKSYTDKKAAAANDGDHSSAIPPSVANANAQLTSADTPTGNAANAMSAADGQVVSADQFNDVDRALREGPPPASAPPLVLASTEAPAAPSAPAAASGDESSAWDQTSLIGKIFIGFGALLTMASAARMFMA